MTDLRKAAEMALEALEWNYGTDLCDIENCMAWLDKMNATIPALRQALAQPEQESVICRNIYEIWAGSEGILKPLTSKEAYLLGLVEQMRDEAKKGLKPQMPPVDAVNISQECVDETAKCKREWVGLTDKELSTLSVSAGIISWSKHDYLADKKQFRELPIDEGMDGDKVCLMQFAQLIEAKLKEKNT